MPKAKPALRFFMYARDLLFPPRCVGCDELLLPFSPEPTIFCPACRERWDAAHVSSAAAAGEAVGYGHAYLVRYKSGETDGVPERLIYHLKHRGDPRAFAFVAAALAFPTCAAIAAAETAAAETAAAETAADEMAADATADATAAPAGAPAEAAPVGNHPAPPLFTYPPRSRAAIRADGHDQAARLARALAGTIGGEFAPLLRRVSTPTDEQKTLTAAERRDNAARAYALRRNAAARIAGRTVILCDDLSTTGATLSVCESLLLSAGARAVVWVTVGQTEGDA